MRNSKPAAAGGSAAALVADRSGCGDDFAVLQRAFHKFNEAGERLEQRYQALLAETERLREQIKEKDLEIQRAERLAALGETAAGIAHEVRNPLGAIRLYVSLLKQDLSGNPASLELVRQVDVCIGSLDRVVSNILQFSREGHGDFSPVNLHSLAREQAEYLRSSQPQFASSFRFQLEGNPFVLGNEDSLRQVLYNLYLNAVQSMRGEGTVTVTCSAADGELRLDVRDEGAGIRPELLDRIFDPFVTTRSEGTGLGLSIVKKIVDSHGGRISVENQGGAIFRLSFCQ